MDDVLGIECRHHYGHTVHPVVAGEPVEFTAYRLTRQWHTFLTDANHSYDVDNAEEPDGFSRVVVRKNALSPYFVLKPAWVEDGPGALWFSQDFRLTTRAMVDAEIASLTDGAVKWHAMAEATRDTVRGRKEASRARSVAREYERQRRVTEARWPLLAQAA